MARARKIQGEKGVSYQLIAYCGYDAKGKQITKTTTWKPPIGMSDERMEKKAIAQAELFEDTISKGSSLFTGKTKFETYAEQWLNNAQLAPKTRERYESLLKRINEAIGHMRLEKIQAHHLEAFYKNLAENGIKNKGRYAIANDLDKFDISIAKLSKMSGLASATISVARSGQRISIKSAEKIAFALEIPTKQLFTLHENTNGLADRTIFHHHRVICAVLGKAKKEGIIPFNVASEHADAPKVKRKEARYLDDTQAQDLVKLLFAEQDIRIRTSLLLALCSGVRRGELCGLSWGDVDEKNHVIHVLRASQYQQKVGIVEVSTKNESSKRPIKLPAFMFEVLTQYKTWWLEQKIINGNRWQGDLNRLFIQENGKPIHPDTINYWLKKFIEKNKLEHFTPHSLRHTFATLQIMSGVNIRTLQARTGHSQASTLTNTYAHAIKTADEMATEVLESVLIPKAPQTTIRQL